MEPESQRPAAGKFQFSIGDLLVLAGMAMLGMLILGTVLNESVELSCGLVIAATLTGACAGIRLATRTRVRAGESVTSEMAAGIGAAWLVLLIGIKCAPVAFKFVCEVFAHVPLLASCYLAIPFSIGYIAHQFSRDEPRRTRAVFIAVTIAIIVQLFVTALVVPSLLRSRMACN